MDSFAFDLATPESAFFSGLAHMVEAPGTLGDFGVLPGHMNFISTLRPGVITIQDEADRILRVFVAGGIAEVNNTSCTILAEHVVPLENFSLADAQARLASAKTALDLAGDETVIEDATREVEISEALVLALA